MPKAIQTLLSELGAKPRIASPSIEKWTELLFNTPEQGIQKSATDESPTVFLSRFGLRTPQAVDTFLKSPAGEVVIAELGAQKELQKAIEREQAIKRQDRELLLLRIKAFLFLLYSGEKAHAKAQLDELIEEQSEKTLEHLNKISAPTTESPAANPQAQLELQNIITNYAQTVVQSQQLYETENKLQQEMHALQQQAQQLQAKYQMFESYIEDSYFTQFMNVQGSINPTAIEQEQTELMERINSLFEVINQRLEANEDPRSIIQEQHGLNLRLATLRDLLAAHAQQKHYVDSEGREVHSLTEAEFILTKGHQLIKHDGKYYLLKPGQDWSTIKDNPEERHHAEQHFERSKHELMTVKKAIRSNRGIEETTHQERTQQVEQQLVQNKEEQRLVGNQLIQLNAARAAAEAALQDFSTTTPTHTLRPTPSPMSTSSSRHTPSPRPSLAAVCQDYKARLDELVKTGKASVKELRALAHQAPEGSRQKIEAYLAQELRGVTPLTTLTGQRLKLLLDRMGTFSGNMLDPANKPAVYQSPTPFSTNPYNK